MAVQTQQNLHRQHVEICLSRKSLKSRHFTFLPFTIWHHDYQLPVEMPTSQKYYNARWNKLIMCVENLRRLLSVSNADSVWPSHLISRCLVVMFLFFISTRLIFKQIFSLKGHNILLFLFIYQPLQLWQPLLNTIVNHPTKERLLCCIDPSRSLVACEKKNAQAS